MEKTAFSNMSLILGSETDAYEYMESLRWPDKPVCPHCGVIAYSGRIRTVIPIQFAQRFRGFRTVIPIVFAQLS